MSFGAGPFYYYTMRKITNTLGALLNGIDIVRYDTANTAQTLPGKVTVPVEYVGKETWFQRLTADPDATLGVQAQLPAITYELLGIQYDPTRKLSGYIKNYIVQSGNNATKFACAFPYNMNFEVNIWTRNIDEGFQVMEQIIPFFDPNYVVALKYLTETGANNVQEFVVDEVPFVLENVRFNNDYTGGQGKVRMVTWTLDFTAKALFFGPTPQVGVIKEVIVNFRDYNSGNLDAIIINTVNPITANKSDNWNVSTQILEGPAALSANI